MKYETPDMEIIKLGTLNVICTSGLTDGSGDDYHEIGDIGTGSTGIKDKW